MKRFCSRVLMLIPGFLLTGIVSAEVNLPQPILDGAGNSLTSVNGQYVIDEASGITRNGNLIHTFQEFNVNTGSSVHFAVEPGNPNQISNIIGNITGENTSLIDGLLQSDASLWLLNPHGFVFQENAVLDIQGSFHAATADQIIFSENDFRLAKDTDVEGVTLSIGNPVGFGFVDSNPGFAEASAPGIRVDLNGRNLTASLAPTAQNPESQTQIDLVGVGIEMNNGSLLVTSGEPSQPPPVALNLVSVAQPADIYLDERMNALRSAEIQTLFTGNSDGFGTLDPVRGGQLSLVDFTFGHEDQLPGGFAQYLLFGGDVVLNRAAFFGASFTEESRLEIASSNLVLADVAIGSTEPERYAPIELKAFAENNFTVAGYASHLNPLTRRANTVLWANGQLQVADFSLELGSEQPFEGDKLGYFFGGESLNFEGVNINLQGPLNWKPALENTTAELLTLRSQGPVTINNSLFTSLGLAGAGSTGNAGGVVIEGSGISLYDTLFDIQTRGDDQSLTLGSGISLDARGGSIYARGMPEHGFLINTLGATSTGRIAIENAADITLDGIHISANSEGSGDAGDVFLASSGRTALTGQTTLVSNSVATGNAGTLTVQGGSVDISESMILSDSLSTEDNSGNAGTVIIVASEGDITGSGDGLINSTSRGGGDAGSITLTADNGAILLKNFSLRSESTSDSFAAGDAGRITLTAQTIAMDNALANVSTFSNRSGATDAGITLVSTAGNITLYSSMTEDGSTGEEGTPSPPAEGGDSSGVPGNSPEMPTSGETGLPTDNMPGGGLPVDQGAQTGLRASSMGAANAGNVLVSSAADFSSTNTVVAADAAGAGSAGTLRVDAQGTIYLTDGAIFATTTNQTGTAGTITLNGKEIRLHGAFIVSDSIDSGINSGDAGAVVLTATGGDIVATTNSLLADTAAGEDSGAAELPSGTSNTISSTTAGGGNANSVELSALNGRVDLTNTVLLSESASASEFAGNAGSIVVTGQGITLVDSTATVTNTGGNLNNTPGSILLDGLGQDIRLQGTLTDGIRASTLGSGIAGNVVLTDAANVLLDGIAVVAETRSSGAAGNIVVDAATDITVTHGALVQSSSRESGIAGTVTLAAGGKIIVTGDPENPTIIESANFQNGQSGSVSLTANELYLGPETALITNTGGNNSGGDIVVRVNQGVTIQGALLEASASGSGDAGTVSVVGKNLTLKDLAKIRTTALESGGGNIDLSAVKTLSFEQSDVSATAGGLKNGGNVNLQAEVMIIDANSTIVAQADRGNGGAITLTAEAILKRTGAAIDASSNAGNDGTVDFEVPDIDISTFIDVLSIPVLDATDLIDRTCDVPARENQSSFVVRGKPLGAEPGRIQHSRMLRESAKTTASYTPYIRDTQYQNVDLALASLILWNDCGK